MPEKMLPQTLSLLQSDVQQRRDKALEISKQGADHWDGDQWHSTGYREQQREKELAIHYLQTAEARLEDAEILPVPSQTDVVDVGHMVAVRFLDDDEVIALGVKRSVVHLLTTCDSSYLGGEYDKVTEMVVSQESPLGQALIGARRGDVVSYNKGQYRVKVLQDSEAIQISSLFPAIES